MSTTITTARPAQALRQRRESQRPGVARVNTRATTVEAADNVPSLPVPLVKTPEYILKKFSGKRPSLILHLHPTHFRFDQQDGSFTYNSPMRLILEHLKEGTVPYMIVEELLAADVPWYDGCLIVEVHDHKTGAKSTPANATNQVGGTSNTPFSINNYNEHITPSPFAPFPTDKLPLKPGISKPTASTSDAVNGVNGVKEADKDNMPAPDQPASASQKKQAKGPRIFTTVLFPTPLSFEEEKNILARTLASDARSIKRILQVSSRDGATPTVGQPLTPLASVPSTPLANKSAPRKPKMALDETNVHEFEAEVIRISNPKLYLEPAKDPEEMFAVLRALADPLHSEKTAGAKTRKRTIAELAADEAQAANEELFALSLDERHQQGVAGGGAASDAPAGAASFEPSFKRFKTLENIKIKHAEAEREKKDAVAREAQMKRQQSEADASKKQDLEKRAQEQKVAEQARNDARNDMSMKQQQAALHQRALAAQQQASVPIATPIASHAPHMKTMMPTTTHPQLQQVQSATRMSPVMRQASQTPMNSSPMVGGPTMSMGMTGVPMVATASSQGAGSPVRPPTALSAHPNGSNMTRQVSQQIGSGHGTPQMLSTPSMGPAVPVTRNMTPQPRSVTQHGSPIAGIQSTPMMNTPSHIPQLTPEQQQQQAAILQANQLRQHQMQNKQAMRNQPNMQHSPQNIQQMMAMQQRQAQMGLAASGQQNPQVMANRQAMLQLQLQQQQNGMQQGSPNNNMMAMQNPMMNQNAVQQQNNPMLAKLQAHRQQLVGQFQQQKRQRETSFVMQHGNGNPDAVPANLRQQFQLNERQKDMEFQQQLQNFTRNQMMQIQQAQNMMRQQSTMNQGGAPTPGAAAGMMQNMTQMGGNSMMGGGGNPAMAQYTALANEQRQRLEQQHRVQNMMGPGQGMQNMQNMQAMPGIQGMNMGNVNAQMMQQAMQQNPALLNQLRLQQMQQQMGQHMGMPQQGMPGPGQGMGM